MNYKTQVCREIVAARARVRAEQQADAMRSIPRADLDRRSVKGAVGPVKRTRAASLVLTQKNGQGTRSEWSQSWDYYSPIERDSRWSA